jgi:hypothetical protein
MKGSSVEMLDQLAEQSRHDDPPFELDYWRLNLIAKKPGD